MKKVVVYPYICLLCLCAVSVVRAQVLSVASGTEFSIKSGTVLAAENLDITPSVDFSLAGNTLSRYTSVANAASFSNIQRVYRFANTTDYFSGIVKYSYNDGELNSNTESSLVLYTQNGSYWKSYSANDRSSSLNYIQSNGLCGTALKELTLSSAAIATWTGAVSTDWAQAGNWSNNAVPSTFTSVVIPSSLTRFPVLSGNSAINDLTLNGNASLNGKTLTINGALDGSGTLKSTSTASLVFNGSGGNAYFDSTDNGLQNLYINANAAGCNTVTLGNAVNVYNSLSPTAATLNANGNLTLKSTSIAQTALVGQTTGSINGKVTVERYIPYGFRAYRDLAAGVYDAGSFYDNWQEGGAYSKPGYGVFITGIADANGTVNSIDASTGIDKSTSGVKSLWKYQNGNWSWIANNKTTNISPYTGYRILVRGDRSFDLFTTPVHQSGTGNYLMMGATTVRTSGKLITGEVKYDYATGVTNGLYSDASILLNATVGGYTAVANPYFSIVDWTKVYGRSSGISPNYWYLDPSVGVSGAYVVYNAYSGSSGSATQYIQPGQSIFVESASATPTLIFKESDKADGPRKSVFGNASVNKLNFSLLKKGAGSKEYRKMDMASLVFGNSFSNGKGMEDAVKMNNPSDNLSILEGNLAYMIDGRKLPLDGETVALGLGKLSTGVYTVEVDATASTGFTAFWVDKVARSETVIGNVRKPFSFEVASKAPVDLDDRFSIRFRNEKQNVPLSALEEDLHSLYKVLGGKGRISVFPPAGADACNVSVYDNQGRLVANSIMKGNALVLKIGPSAQAYIVTLSDMKGTSAKKVFVD